jgi:hypothetical protein
MNTKSQRYKKIELTADAVPVPQFNFQKLTVQPKRVGQWIFHALTTKPEFKIWQRKDRAGNIWWHVYDPNIDRTVCECFGRRSTDVDRRIFLSPEYSERSPE